MLSEAFFRVKIGFAVLAPNSNFADNFGNIRQYIRTRVEIGKTGDVTPQIQQISTRCKKPFCSSVSWAARVASPNKNNSKKSYLTQIYKNYLEDENGVPVVGEGDFGLVVGGDAAAAGAYYDAPASVQKGVAV